MKPKLILIFLVLLLGLFLRFYQLGSIPNGIDIDEASIGYDAYSLSVTGKDRYGEVLPIFMRSFGNYQSPLYTYLTAAPIYLFGLSAFATRFVSAVSGIIILVCTFFLILNLNIARRFSLAFIAALLVAISPWAILFSRTAVEANLALALLVLGILLLILSLKQRKILFIFGCLMLALSTYAYHAERVISVIFLGLFVYFFKKDLFLNKRNLLLGIIIFLMILVPQLLLVDSSGSKGRIGQVQYFSDNYFQKNSSFFSSLPMGRVLFIVNKFMAQYITYFSPNNLFFRADEQVIRSMPDLSLFYSWMIIPFILGIRELLKLRSTVVVKILLILLLISPLPAAITREPFYTIRALPLFWIITIIIALGVSVILEKIKSTLLRYIILVAIVLSSFLFIYNSYFILLKYERMDGFGYYNIKLLNELKEYKEIRVIIDSTRANLAMWYLFITKYSPFDAQKQLRSYVQQGYYSSDPDKDSYRFDNIEFRPINFSTDSCKGNIIVGDLLSISETQEKAHNLKTLFEIKDLNNRVKFKVYSSDSNKKC